MPGQPPQDCSWDDLLGPDSPGPADIEATLREGIGERRAYVRVPDGYHGLADDEGGGAALSKARELREQLGI